MEWKQQIDAEDESITQLLLAWREGDTAAFERMIPMVYQEMRRIASRHHRRQPDQMLQTTALVHEAYLRLIDTSQVSWQNRAHFLAVSAQLMRRILVDFARRQASRKRGGGERKQVSLEEVILTVPERGVEVIALDEALEQLSRLHTRQARVVELRYFGGLNEEETAEVLGVSVRSVQRDWHLARLWLYQCLQGGVRDVDVA
jgi:RNA polymerase sigma-70 factor (ECF subfamily)